MQAVRNRSVWNQVRIAFIAAGFLFFINNFFGFDNVLTYPVLARWQLLIHLHAGTLGWITLSVIGFAVWAFTGQRDVSDRYARTIRVLVGGTIAAFALYIPFFALAFSQGPPYFVLLSIFGSFALIMIWAAFLYTVVQARRQPVLTTAQLLLLGALLVAAVGGLMGVLIDLEFTTGQFLPIVGPSRAGVHAGMMDTYLFLAAAAIVEGLLVADPGKRWTRIGATQAGAWTIGALLVPIFFMTGVMQLLLVFVILLFLGLGLFLARTGRHALSKNPLRGGVRAWMFAGTLWFIVYTGLFTYALIVLVPQGFSGAPSWFFPLFAHAPFVGMMTNLILGAFSARTEGSRTVFRVGEPIAQWLINLGILAFVLFLAAYGTPLGAVVMGTGVVVGVVTMLVRLFRSGFGGAAPAPPIEG